jgi:hypothetical protein
MSAYACVTCARSTSEAGTCCGAPLIEVIEPTPEEIGRIVAEALAANPEAAQAATTALYELSYSTGQLRSFREEALAQLAAAIMGAFVAELRLHRLAIDGRRRKSGT